MTYSPEARQKLKKSLSYWGAGYAVVAGFLYYHSYVPLGPVLIAGILTLALTIYRAQKP